MRFYVKSSCEYDYWDAKVDLWKRMESDVEGIILINCDINHVEDIKQEIEYSTMTDNEDENFNNYRYMQINIKILTRVD